VSSVDVLPILLVVAKILLAVVGIVYLLSGSDDCFMDLCFVVMTLRRRNAGPPPLGTLLTWPERPMAIMVPAWDEADVIGRMVANILTSVRYSNFHVFVGTYPNDAATQQEVDAVAAAFPNVHRVVCANPGPTCKSDCLNWIYQGILDFEQRSGVTFSTFVIHDAEDVPHPLSFKLFNYLMPPYDMVQLPVLCLPSPWHRFTAMHYLDEFAEQHLKDLPVREWLTRTVPGAGVGCAFSRRALAVLAAHSDNEIFSLDSLTEDYEIGMRLRRLGLMQAFVKIAIDGEYIGTSEYFPAKLSQAVRQKSRWIVGITLQGWRSLGWAGDARMKYALFRDRKGLLTNQIAMLGYVAVAFVASVWIVTSMTPDAYRYPPLVERGSWLWYMMYVNALFMLERLIVRSLCVQHVYGWRQAVLALPRQVWSNVVNFGATSRAMRLWLRHRWTGRPIAWDKTGHVFPSEAQLRLHRGQPADTVLGQVQEARDAA
jgi:bacteriophage N4 adsorption protein B